jgi:hypothetical protein
MVWYNCCGLWFTQRQPSRYARTTANPLFNQTAIDLQDSRLTSTSGIISGVDSPVIRHDQRGLLAHTAHGAPLLDSGLALGINGDLRGGSLWKQSKQIARA